VTAPPKTISPNPAPPRNPVRCMVVVRVRGDPTGDRGDRILALGNIMDWFKTMTTIE
jgi:hypothetical protein